MLIDSPSTAAAAPWGDAAGTPSVARNTGATLPHLAQLASRLLEAPIALIAPVGDEPIAANRAKSWPRLPNLESDRTGLDPSLCRWAAAQGEPLCIADTQRHPLWPEELAACAPGVRAYIGVPLRSAAGETLGSLCVMDTRRREWSEALLGVLEELAAVVAVEMEECRGRREAEAERERYARRVDDVDAIVWEADPKTWRFTFVSEQAEALLGYPRSRWLEEPDFWVSLIHPEDRDSATQICSTATAAGQDHAFEYRAIAADGRIVWLRDRVRVICNAEGSAENLIGFMVDITAQKLAEEQLQHVISSAQCLLWEAAIEEREGRLHWEHQVPDEAAALCFLPLSLRPGQAYVEAWKESRLPEDLPRLRARSERACREGLSRYVQEYRCRRADGTVRWLFEDVKIDRVAEGRWYAVGVCSDITERKEAELALAERERRFRSLIENSSDVITILDAEGVIIYASPSIHRLLGYAPEETVGRPPFELIHPEEHSALLTLFHGVISGEARQPSVSAPFRFRAKDGSWRWLESTATNLLRDPVVRGVIVNSRDVTERMVMETALRESEERYRRIVETTSEGVWMIDAEARTTYVNQQLAGMLGYTPEEMLGRLPTEFISAEDRPATEARWARRREGIAERYDARCLRKDGSEVWMLVSATPRWGDSGEYLGSLAMVTDITERKRSEMQLHYVTTNANCILWLAEIEEIGEDLPDWRLHLPDPAAAQRFFPLDVAPGQRYAQAWYESRLDPDREESDRIGNAAVRAGRSFSQEFRCRNRHGEVRWLREDVQIETVAPGRWRGVGVTTDITDRKQAEERKAALQTLGRSLNMATTPEAAARVVLDVSDRLIGWDACWLELCDPEGRSARTVLLMDEIDGRRQEVPAPCDNLLASSLALKAINEGPFLLLRRPEDPPRSELPFGDTSRPSASLLCVPIRSGERVVGAMSIQSYACDAYDEEDLQTFQALADYCAGALERTQAEAAHLHLQQQLAQAQKMQAVGRLAGGIAHDFNNMLAVINGYADLLLGHPDMAGTLRPSLGEIRRAGDRAASLTSQLLAFSRKQILQPQALRLEGVVLSTQRMLQHLIGEDIELVTHTHEDVGYVKADPGQLEQVLVNLAVNARDAMPQGGTLTVDLRSVHLAERLLESGERVRPGPYICLGVSDTGCGMDSRTLAHVFEPFFTTKPVGQGTGLGLATVYGIVEQHQGHIEIDSAPGRGTTFRIYLPKLDEPGPAPAPPQSGSPPTGDETVLVVEDEEMLRRLICRVLRMNGYQVLEAANANEALQRCQEHRGAIDLLLTDVVMPGRSGRELAVFATARYPELKVIYMSGYTDDAVVRHGVSATEAPFLQKPFTALVLTQKVRDVLDREHRAG